MQPQEAKANTLQPGPVELYGEEQLLLRSKEEENLLLRNIVVCSQGSSSRTSLGNSNSTLSRQGYAHLKYPSHPPTLHADTIRTPLHHPIHSDSSLRSHLAAASALCNLSQVLISATHSSSFGGAGMIIVIARAVYASTFMLNVVRLERMENERATIYFACANPIAPTSYHAGTSFTSMP